MTLSAVLIASTFTTNTYAAESDDPELFKKAYSLGADKDYLCVQNYSHSEELPLNIKCYEDFLANCSLIEKTYYPALCFSECVAGGSCVGIAMLEVLSHNGVIKPSDIHKDATYLSEIEYDNESDRYITYYQASQGYILFDYYEKYLANNYNYNECIDNLIQTAEHCMSENKYFLITVRSEDTVKKENFSHCVCGIGITDGEWSFNNVTYDKCIMTLDSNVIDKEGTPKGFSNKSCIYINSETKQSCIPAYEIYSIDTVNLIFTAIDDDTLLNYKGLINPANEIKTDVSNLKSFSSEVYGDKAKIYTITNGEKTLLPKQIFKDRSGAASYFIGDSVHAEVREFKETGFIEGYPTFRYITDDRWINIDLFEKPDKEVNIDVDISNDMVSIKNYGEKRKINGLQIMMNDDSFKFAPYYWWKFKGELNEFLDIEIRDEGLLIKRNDVSS